MTEIAHYTMLEGQGGQVTTQLHSSGTQGLGLRTEVV